MISRLIASITLTLGLAGAAFAFDMSAMDATEREAFRAEIRAYLLENPEVLIEAISVLEERQAQEQLQGDAALLSQYSGLILDDGFSYQGGNLDGDITVVEFLDYRCGYCKRAHPEVSELIASDGNIRYIIKEFPILGEQSTLASRFALSTRIVAGDEAYIAVHDYLMQDSGGVSIQSLRRIANTLGLDSDGIIDGMEDPQIDQILAANRALAQALQISGTPSFILGDTMMRGYAPLATMQEMIAQQRG